TAVTNQRRIHAAKAGAEGTYKFKASVADSRGGTAEKTCSISVTNSAPKFTTSALDNATTCLDYSFQISATDPDNNTISGYSATGLPSGLSISSSGLISGVPESKGDYSVTITVKDYYGKSTSKEFTLIVKDESFSASVSSDDTTIYVYPGVSSYHEPVQYNGQASVTTKSSVTYTLTSSPDWLAISNTSGNQGQIQGTPTDNANDPGTYDITVKATNSCNLSASANLNLTVNANEWCGDGTVNGASETCDNGSSNTDTACSPAYGSSCSYCDTSCKGHSSTGGSCGDGIVQSGSEQCERAGNGTSSSDQYSCSGCQWSGGWCGDGSCSSGETQSSCYDDCGPKIYGGRAYKACTNAGGEVVSAAGVDFCRFNVANCPSGWTSYSDSSGSWMTTTSKTCSGTGGTISRTGSCGTKSCTAASCTASAGGWGSSNTVYDAKACSYTYCSENTSNRGGNSICNDYVDMFGSGGKSTYKYYDNVFNSQYNTYDRKYIYETTTTCYPEITQRGCY
ncbi:putative Ig domain-containing protein, partial [Candidatus Falkowbacteria bacterium]|nr:putative Ig domain-containing protein [Candidatus Falkowbacteria bacterium]